MDPTGDPADDDEVDVVTDQGSEQWVEFELLAQVIFVHVPLSPGRRVLSPPAAPHEFGKSGALLDPIGGRETQVRFVESDVDAGVGLSRTDRQLLAEEVEELTQGLDGRRKPI